MTALAPRAQKAVSKDAALEVIPELFLHEVGKWPSTLFIDEPQECFEVLLNDLIKDRGLGLVPLVRGLKSCGLCSHRAGLCKLVALAISLAIAAWDRGCPPFGRSGRTLRVPVALEAHLGNTLCVRHAQALSGRLERAIPCTRRPCE